MLNTKHCTVQICVDLRGVAELCNTYLKSNVDSAQMWLDYVLELQSIVRFATCKAL